MDAGSVGALERARDLLLKDLDPDRVVPRLQAWGFLTGEEVEDMREQANGRRQRIDLLLELYKEKANNLEPLKRALREVGDFHLVSALEHDPAIRSASTGQLVAVAGPSGAVVPALPTHPSWEPTVDNVRGWLSRGKVPKGPLGLVDRAVLVEELRSRMRALKTESFSWTLFLHGMAGCGKSVLAAEALRDKDFLHHICVGEVRWLKIGSNGAAREMGILKDLWARLQRQSSGALVEDGKSSKAQLVARIQEAIDSRYPHLLVVLDDVVSEEVLETFQDLRCGCLVTTRNVFLSRKLSNRGLDKMAMEPQSFSPAEAYELLRRRTGLEELPGEWREMWSLTAGHPLVLSILAALLCERPNWHIYTKCLRLQRHGEIELQTSYPAPSLEVALALSLKELEEREAELHEAYLSLAIFPLDVPIPDSVVAVLWANNSNNNGPSACADSWDLHKVTKVQRKLESLVERSLLVQVDSGSEPLQSPLSPKDEKADGRVRDRAGSYPSPQRVVSHSYLIHRLVHASLKRSFTNELNLDKLRRKLVTGLEAALGEPTHPDHEVLQRYFYQCLGYHLFKAKQWDRFPHYYLSLERLGLMLRYVGVKDVVTDLFVHDQLIGRWEKEKAAALRDFLRSQARHVHSTDLVQLALLQPKDSLVHKAALEQLADREPEPRYLERCEVASETGEDESAGWRCVQEILLGFRSGSARALDAKGLYFVVAPADKPFLFVYNGEMSRVVERRRLPAPAIALTVAFVSKEEWELSVACGGPTILLYSCDLSRVREELAPPSRPEPMPSDGGDSRDEHKTPSPIQRFLSEAVLVDRDEDFAPPEAAKSAAKFDVPEWGIGPGPQRVVRDCLASPDGTQMAGSTEDGGVFLWSAIKTDLQHTLEAGARRRRLSGGSDSEVDGKRSSLASTSTQDEADARTMCQAMAAKLSLGSLGGRTPSPTSGSVTLSESLSLRGGSEPRLGLLAYHHSGRFVAVAWRRSGRGKIWETATGQLHSKFHHDNLAVRPVFVNSLRLDGSKLEFVTGSSEEAVSWGAEGSEGSSRGGSARQLGRIRFTGTSGGELRAMGTARDFLLTGWEDGGIRVFALVEGEQVALLSGHSGAVQNLGPFPPVEGRQPNPFLVLSSAEDHFVSVWDIGALERKSSWQSHRQRSVGLVSLAQGAVVAEASGSLDLWREGKDGFHPPGLAAQNGHSSGHTNGTSNGTSNGAPAVNGASLRKISALSGAGSSVALAWDDGAIELFSAADSGALKKVKRAEPKALRLSKVSQLLMSPDEAALASWASSDLRLQLLHLPSCAPVMISLTRIGIPEVGLWASASQLLLATGQGQLGVVSRADPAAPWALHKVHSVEPGDATLELTALAVAEETLVVGSAKGSLHFLVLPTLQPAEGPRMMASSEAVTALEASGSLVAVGRSCGTVEVLRLARGGRPELVLRRERDSGRPVRRLCFSPELFAVLSERLEVWQRPGAGTTSPGPQGPLASVPLPGGPATHLAAAKDLRSFLLVDSAQQLHRFHF